MEAGNFQIPTPPNMPRELLVKFCLRQREFWDSFLKDVEQYYTTQPPETPTREPPSEPIVPDAPRKQPPSEPIVPDASSKRNLDAEFEKTIEKDFVPNIEEPVKNRKIKKGNKTREGEEGNGPKPPKQTRGPSKYNLYISSEVERLRKETPDLNHKVAFAMAVASWKEKKESENKIPEPPSPKEPVTVDPQTIALDDVC